MFAELYLASWLQVFPPLSVTLVIVGVALVSRTCITAVRVLPTAVLPVVPVLPVPPGAVVLTEVATADSFPPNVCIGPKLTGSVCQRFRPG